MKEELKQFGILEENVSLKNYNTYKIDTSTKYLLHPRNMYELQQFLIYIKEKDISFFILGNGSNVILSDTMYDGIIVILDEFQKLEYIENKVIVGAGVMIQKLAFDIIKHGLSGLEWATGIPGTIGGCIFGNAEAYKVSTFEYLDNVTFLDFEGNIIKKEKSELSHGYRTSFFKENPYYVIVESEFTFPNGNEEESMNIIKDRTDRRLKSQPLNYPSAGSVFRNPTPESSSGKLMDDLGLKGTTIGDAEVSQLHANFIINKGHATGKDIRDLIKLIQNEVKEKSNIDLILEQEYKNW